MFQKENQQKITQKHENRISGFGNGTTNALFSPQYCELDERTSAPRRTSRRGRPAKNTTSSAPPPPPIHEGHRSPLTVPTTSRLPAASSPIVQKKIGDRSSDSVTDTNDTSLSGVSPIRSENTSVYTRESERNVPLKKRKLSSIEDGYSPADHEVDHEFSHIQRVIVSPSDPNAPGPATSANERHVEVPHAFSHLQRNFSPEDVNNIDNTGSGTRDNGHVAGIREHHRNIQVNGQSYSLPVVSRPSVSLNNKLPVMRPVGIRSAGAARQTTPARIYPSGNTLYPGLTRPIARSVTPRNNLPYQGPTGQVRFTQPQSTTAESVPSTDTNTDHADEIAEFLQRSEAGDSSFADVMMSANFMNGGVVRENTVTTDNIGASDNTGTTTDTTLAVTEPPVGAGGFILDMDADKRSGFPGPGDDVRENITGSSQDMHTSQEKVCSQDTNSSQDVHSSQETEEPPTQADDEQSQDTSGTNDNSSGRGRMTLGEKLNKKIVAIEVS